MPIKKAIPAHAHKRPRDRCAPEERDEVAAGHSMTSSTSASTHSESTDTRTYARLAFGCEWGGGGALWPLL